MKTRSDPVRCSALYRAAGRAQEHSQRPRTKASSFHRLLLRFDQLRRGFEKCHALFREIDADRNGVIDLRARPAACLRWNVRTAGQFPAGACLQSSRTPRPAA